MPLYQLDLENGLVLCTKCNKRVKPKYTRVSSNLCLCSICNFVIRNASKRRIYIDGKKWCTICQEFQEGWDKNPTYCVECHHKMRVRGYTKYAKQRREVSIKRY